MIQFVYFSEVGHFVFHNFFKGFALGYSVQSLNGNIRILNNKEIKDVINLTQLNSKAKADIKVPINEPFQKIRELMDRELPEIGKANPEILSGPSYSGITRTDEITNQLIISVSAECREEDRSNVTCYLYEAVIELLNKEGCLAENDIPGKES